MKQTWLGGCAYSRWYDIFRHVSDLFRGEFFGLNYNTPAHLDAGSDRG